MGTEVIVTA